ncbi:MAG: SpoIID/LytB domain-containing protein [Lachnospiraceae bacterium]|nr:SpoIID/LytB domain-containing protein [Lachnospiraceae bacterium]
MADNKKKTTRNKIKKSNRKRRKKKINKKRLIIIGVVAVTVVALIVCLTIFIIKKNTENVPTKIASISDINVLLTNGDKRSWDEITISNDKGMTWTEDGVAHNANNGEAITFSNKRAQGTVIELSPIEAGGRFAIKTGDKGDGYLGTIQLHYTSDGLQVTNYVPLEEYIKGVICSEMPVRYGLEALKAQAVCARSYVLSKGGDFAYEEAQAHVDDTVSYQVYGDTWANGDAITAVEQTAGEVVMTSEGDIVNTMFYSTSCGYSQTQKAIDFPYLARRYISLSSTDPLKEAGVSVADTEVDTDKNFEEAFAKYIKNPDENALENNMPYFRWEAVVDIPANIDEIKSELISEYSKGNTGDAGTKKVTIDKSLSNNALDKSANSLNKDKFGNFKSMEVKKRSTGGVITSLSMVFDNGCVIINDELVIRRILANGLKSLVLNDNSKKDVSSLPSAAFTFSMEEDGCHIYGGGFGHGCGMSQNAARAMASEGKNYSEILQFFYKDCNVGKL